MRPRILLVEDDPTSRQVVIRMLQNLGHSVETAINGRQALEALAQVTGPGIAGEPDPHRLRGRAADGHDPLFVLRPFKKQHPAVNVIALSGHNHTTAVFHSGGVLVLVAGGAGACAVSGRGPSSPSGRGAA